MKVPEWLIWLVVAAAFFQTALGGLRDLTKRNSVVPSMHHAFNDGIFLILVAIFMVLYNKA